MTNEDRIRNLRSLGYTQTEASFLVVAALHSGHFVRPQFCAFASATRGGAETRFIEKLTANHHVEPTSYRFNRLVYRLGSRRLYEALGEGDNRNRRACQPYTVRHKLLTLDFVLSRKSGQFLPTLEDRLAYFSGRGIPTESLPVRIYRSKDGKQQTPVYLFDRSPVYIDPSLSPPVVSFAFINDGDFAYRDLRSFLNGHRALFAVLTEFKLIFAAPDKHLFGKAATLFGKFLWTEGGSARELISFFGERQAFERRETQGWDKARIDRFRDNRDHFSGSNFEALYVRWKSAGDTAIACKTTTLNGSLETVLLPHKYDLFGGQSDAV